MNEEAQKNIDALSAQEVTPVSPLPIELVNIRNKFSKLVNNNSPELHVNGANKEFNLSFIEKVFVHRIELHTDGYISGHEAECSYTSLQHSYPIKRAVKWQNDILSFEINDIVDGITIKPPKSSFFGVGTRKKLIKLVIFGIPQDKLNEVFQQLGGINNYKQNALNACQQTFNQEAELKEQITALQQQEQEGRNRVETLQTEISDKTSSGEELSEELVKIKSQIDANGKQEAELLSRIDGHEDTIDKKKNEISTLNGEVSKKNQDLKSLKNDINIFPTEIREFVNQGERSIVRYSILGLIPLGVLSVVTWLLWNNAADLTVLYRKDASIDIWTVFLSRLPYVAISAFLIAVSFKLVERFIEQVIRINDQRLNLSKIAIIAKDVSDASLNDLDLSDEESYERRTYLKMELLKEHLKNYISDDFEYKKVDQSQEIEEDPKVVEEEKVAAE